MIVTIIPGEMNGQNIANTAWVFATVRQSDEKLFVAFAWILELRMREFLPQTLTNAAWAFATATQSHMKLFVAIATAARPR